MLIVKETIFMPHRTLKVQVPLGSMDNQESAVEEMSSGSVIVSQVHLFRLMIKRHTQDLMHPVMQA